MTFCDWSAAHSSTNHCNCFRKSCHLSSLAWMGLEQTIPSRLCLISASVYQRSRKWLQLKSKRRRKRWCQWRTMVRRPRMFCLALVAYASLKKFQISWLAEHCLVLLFKGPTSFYRRIVYVHTNMHAVSVCFRIPPNYDMDYRIFNVPTWSSIACIYTHKTSYIWDGAVI